MLKLRKNKKGFSLVELIVVIAIMAVLAGVVGGTLFSQLNKQKNNSANSEVQTLANSLKTSIMADKNYGNAVGVTGTALNLSAIVTDFKDENGTALTGTQTGAKAGEHQFYIQVLATNAVVIHYNRVGSGAAVAGYVVYYVDGAADAADAKVLVKSYEGAVFPTGVTLNAAKTEITINTAAPAGGGGGSGSVTL